MFDICCEGEGHRTFNRANRCKGFFVKLRSAGTEMVRFCEAVIVCGVKVVREVQVTSSVTTEDVEKGWAVGHARVKVCRVWVAALSSLLNILQTCSCSGCCCVHLPRQ